MGIGKKLGRPSHTTIAAYLSLFLVIGGGVAFAALGKNTVGTRQLKRNAVTAAKIRNGAVSVVKLNSGARAALKGQEGPPGPPGPPVPGFGAIAIGPQESSEPNPSPDESAANVAKLGRQVEVTLPRAGELYIRFFTATMKRDCSAGSAEAGLYLDGAPIPATARGLFKTASETERAEEYLALVPADAGEHDVTLRQDCPSGDLGPSTIDGHSTWTVLLLGS